MSSTKAFRYTSFAITIFEKIIGANFTVTGKENIPDNPVMFVANHFTRSETFFVPYLINKHLGRQVRCLAASGLFHGALGRFLRSTGNISTGNPKRNEIIISDLMTRNYDWMIYPEGAMVKSKEIKIGDNVIMNYTPDRIGSVRTGSAVLALKAELYRQDIREALANKDKEAAKNFEYKFLISAKNTSKVPVNIVPITITYYPLRPGRNLFLNIAGKLLKKLPRGIAEDLEVEGNFLLDSQINIHFGEAIDLAEYSEKMRSSMKSIPILSKETKSNLIVRRLRSRLTQDFMTKIYRSVLVNFDHIFCAVLYHSKRRNLSLDDFKRLIYLSAVGVGKLKNYRLHDSVLEKNVVKIFSDEPYKEFDEAFELAKKLEFIRKFENGNIALKSLTRKQYGFNEVRLKNPFYVIANEFNLLERAKFMVQNILAIKEEELKMRTFDAIFKADLKEYDFDYEEYFDKKFSKDKEIGKPFVSGDISDEKVGIVLSHGYKSSPQEVAALSKYLAKLGFVVYAVRLKGHGTSPINLKDVKYQQWYDSFQRGYCALNNVCSKIVVVGFSTGGLLTLLSAAQKNSDSKLSGLVTINAAIKLSDIRTKAVPAIKFWNEMLDKFSIEKGRYEYVDDVPENPDLNYSRNYLNGVNELGKLISKSSKNLSKIRLPTLIIQGSSDPVVNPESAKIIFDKITSEKKLIQEMDFNNHVIVNGKNKEKVFEVIQNFLFDLNSKK